MDVGEVVEGFASGEQAVGNGGIVFVGIYADQHFIGNAALREAAGR